MPSRSLHIVVDGRELVGRPTGVGRYLLAVLREWAGASNQHRYTVVLPGAPPAELRALGPRFEWSIEPATVAGTWWEQVRLPRIVARLRADVLFAPGYTAPLQAPCPVVVAIYDVSFFAHPEWFGWREGLRRRWITKRAARSARAVVTISEFSRDEIVKYVGVPGDRLVIAPPGAPLPTKRANAAHRAETILYAGSLFTRRHVPEMIEAFARTASSVPGSRFVLVGDNRTSPTVDPMEIAARFGAADRVNWRAYVSDAELDALYQEAKAFLFLSDYEGFGMTPLEALAAGVPSVLLDTPISREIYGEGAVRVPLDVTAISAALTQLLTDEPRRAAVLAAGQSRLAAFSWARTAATIAETLERATS